MAINSNYTGFVIVLDGSSLLCINKYIYIYNKNLLIKKQELYVHNDEHKVSKTITTKSKWETKRVLEINNRSTMCKIPTSRPIK